MYFVTGNKNKLNEVLKFLDVECIEVDLPEVQGDPLHVAKEKYKAAECLVPEDADFFVEDTALCFNALGGLPGVYVKWFLNKIGPQGLYRLLADFTDKTAYAQTIICVRKSGQCHLIDGRTDGFIVEPNTTGFGWDPIFKPIDSTKTYGEMTLEEKNQVSHRAKAMHLLKQLID